MSEASQETIAPKSPVRRRYVLIGSFSLAVGLVFVLLGVVWGFAIGGAFSNVGGSFMGGFLADIPSQDYSYTVVLLLDLIVVILGLILSSIGAIALNMGLED